MIVHDSFIMEKVTGLRTFSGIKMEYEYQEEISSNPEGVSYFLS